MTGDLGSGWIVPLVEASGTNEAPTESNSEVASEEVAKTIRRAHAIRVIIPHWRRRSVEGLPPPPRRTRVTLAWRGFLTPLRC